MKVLNQSHVLFNVTEHTYTATDGSQLSGITSIIHSMIFPDMYSNVPESVLAKAALRGTEIHRDIELYSEMGIVGESASNELTEYVQYITEHKIKTLASEYLVDSYDLGIATAIDIVWDTDEDGFVDLADIKTTSVLNIEYLRWQLSICAVLFELQNPHLKVRNLYGVHLRSGCKVVEIKRIYDEHVYSLLKAWKDGEEYVNPLHILPDDFQSLLDAYNSYEQEAIDVRQALEYIEEREVDIKAKLMEMMQAQSMNKYKDEHVDIAIRRGCSRDTFDFKRYAKENSDLDLSQYIKKIEVKPTISIKLI